MEEYEINDNTLALIPFDDNKTKIYENNKVFIVNKNIIKIMDFSCEYFGSSLNGRQKGTFNLIGITHKVPIIVEESKEIIFFPTMSPRIDKCSWFSLKNITKIFSENNKNYILFNNNIIIEADVSFGVLNNQLLRATRLESVLRNRKLIK